MNLSMQSELLISRIDAILNPFVSVEEAKPYVESFETLYKRKPEYVLVPMAQNADTAARVGAMLLMLQDLNGFWATLANPASDPSNLYGQIYSRDWTTPRSLGPEMNWGHLFIFKWSDFDYLFGEKPKKDATADFPPQLYGWTPVHIYTSDRKRYVSFGPTILHPELNSMETHKELIDSLIAAEPILVHDMKQKTHFEGLSITVPVLTEGREVDNSGQTQVHLAGPTKSILLGDGVVVNTFIAKPVTATTARDRFDPDYNPYQLHMREMRAVDCLALPDEFLMQIGNMEEYFCTQRDTVRGRTPEKKRTDKEKLADGRETVISAMFSPQQHFLIVTDKTGKPVGLVFYSTPKGKPIHLDYLYVVEGERDKGYGGWILENFFQEVFLLPDSLPLVTVTTIGDNDRLLKFYFSHGFCPYSLDVLYFPQKSKELTNIVVS